MGTWLSDHWGEAITGIGAAGGIGASIKLWPRFWRGLMRTIASPFLLEIERERRLARDAQVIDLTDQIETLQDRIEAYEERERARASGPG